MTKSDTIIYRWQFDFLLPLYFVSASANIQSVAFLKLRLFLFPSSEQSSTKYEKSHHVSLMFLLHLDTWIYLAELVSFVIQIFKIYWTSVLGPHFLPQFPKKITKLKIFKSFSSFGSANSQVQSDLKFSDAKLSGKRGKNVRKTSN